LTVIGLAIFDEGIAANFSWQDGKEIHTATTSQIERRMVLKGGPIHVNIQNGENSARWTYNEKLLWRTVWRKFPAPCKNMFLWQLAYRATQSTITQVEADGTIIRERRLRNDPATWCKCCSNQVHETQEHCFWLCTTAIKVGPGCKISCATPPTPIQQFSD
jgi:hypothetical protein